MTRGERQADRMIGPSGDRVGAIDSSSIKREDRTAISPKAEFSRAMGNERRGTQSYLLGRFVSKDELSAKPFHEHWRRRMNAGDVPLPDGSGSPRKPDRMVAFLQNVPACAC